jgi:hypothetical protein
MVTQLSPTIPQYLRVDIPRLREGIPQRSGGRIQVTLASWPERNLNGPELLRVLRAGQIDLGGIALPTVAGDVPLLDIIDLAGLLQSHEQGRRVAEAMMPEINRELERVGVRIIATYPFPAQVFFCRDPIASLADLKGKRVRTPGGSQNDFIQAIGAQPVAIGFPEVYGALERGVVDCAVTGTGHRQRRALVRGDAPPLHVARAVGHRRLRRQSRLVEQARRAGPRFPAEGHEGGRGRAVAARPRADRGWRRLQFRPARGLQDRPPRREPADAVTPATQADTETLRASLTSVVLPAWVKRCGERCGETYNRLVAPITGIRYEPR